MDSLELRNQITRVNRRCSGYLIRLPYEMGDKYKLYLHYMKERPVFLYNLVKPSVDCVDLYFPTSSEWDTSIPKNSIIELVQYARYIQKINHNHKTYYVAQGFLAEGENPLDNIIFLHSVNKFLSRGDVTGEDINLYINKKYIGNSDYKKEQLIIKEFVNICKGDIIYTNDPLKKFEQRFIFKSRSIQGLKRELERIVQPILADLQSETVDSMVKEEALKQDCNIVLFEEDFIILQ